MGEWASCPHFPNNQSTYILHNTRNHVDQENASRYFKAWREQRPETEIIYKGSMETITNGKILFAITVEDVQREAMEILGRKLNDEEISKTEKYLSYGIGESIGIVYNTIFKELI
jgi:hypothetical protein